ncbi:MAG: hypothetical protein ACOCSN_04250 [Halanaeroarchaeum sp.]
MVDHDRESNSPPDPNEDESGVAETIDAFVSTTEDFETLLRVLVLAADAKGIDVRGGWPVVSDDDDSGSWDVEIVEIVRDH